MILILAEQSRALNKHSQLYPGVESYVVVFFIVLQQIWESWWTSWTRVSWRTFVVFYRFRSQTWNLSRKEAPVSSNWLSSMIFQLQFQLSKIEAMISNLWLFFEIKWRLLYALITINYFCSFINFKLFFLLLKRIVDVFDLFFNFSFASTCPRWSGQEGTVAKRVGRQ